jgi:toxin ParE1/3/4
MTQQFRLTEPAIRDIEEIADYIAKQSGLVQSEFF